MTKGPRVTRRLGTAAVISGLVLAGLAQTAGATPVPVAIAVSLDRTSIRADGRDVAVLQVDASTSVGPLANATIKLSAKFTTPASPGAVKFGPTSSVLLDGNGHGTATVTSTRSGTATIAATIGTTAFKGGGTVNLDARRRSVVVFASGASSVVTCTAPGVCGDNGTFNSIRTLLAPQGFTAGDFATFSYAGGLVDPTTHRWIPKASTCADSALDYKIQVGRLRTMVRQIAGANPNSDFTLVGLSQGGILVFQMLAAQTTPLPKGSRLANIVSLDGPIGGVPLAQLLNLELNGGIGSSCWSLGGTSKAASELVSLWNTTAPTQGPQQADRTPIMCRLVGYLPCASAGTNEQVVAARSDVVVQTWGSSQDGVFDPTVCGVAGPWVSALDTQAVTGAGGGLHPEGSASPGPGCTLGSHVAVLTTRAPDVAATVGLQQ